MPTTGGKNFVPSFFNHVSYKKLHICTSSTRLVEKKNGEEQKKKRKETKKRRSVRAVLLKSMKKQKQFRLFANKEGKTVNNFQERNFLPKFFSRSFEKNRLKKLVGWFIKKWGLPKTLKLLETLKVLGFKNAQTSGISLNLEDLYIPFQKESMVKINELQLLEQEFKVFQKTNDQTTYSVKFISSWTVINQLLRNAFLQYFKTRLIPSNQPFGLETLKNTPTSSLPEKPKKLPIKTGTKKSSNFLNNNILNPKKSNSKSRYFSSITNFGKGTHLRNRFTSLMGKNSNKCFEFFNSNSIEVESKPNSFSSFFEIVSN